MCIMVFEANLPGIHWKCLHIKARDTEMLTAFVTTQGMTQKRFLCICEVQVQDLKIEGSYFNYKMAQYLNKSER